MNLQASHIRRVVLLFTLAWLITIVRTFVFGYGWLETRTIRAEARWESHQIDSYEAAVRVDSGPMLGTQVIYLTVIDGKIANSFGECEDPGLLDTIDVVSIQIIAATASCSPLTPEDYTIEAIYEQTHRVLDERTAGSGSRIRLVYDLIYDYPRSIRHTNPFMGESRWSIEIISFTPLP